MLAEETGGSNEGRRRRPVADDALAVLAESKQPMSAFEVMDSLQQNGLCVSEKKARRLLNILVIEGRATIPRHGMFQLMPPELAD